MRTSEFRSTNLGIKTGENMENNTLPERPSKVTFALYMLYACLGISVIPVLVSWVRFGAPGWVGYKLITFPLQLALFHFWAPIGAMLYGNLIILPVAVWLYFMIGKGKNWARITLLIYVILEILLTICLEVFAFSMFYHHPNPTLSLSGFFMRISPEILQDVFQIVAVTFLFGRVSSGWFKAMRICNQQPRTEAKVGVARVAVGLLGMLTVGLVVYQVADVSQRKVLVEAIGKNDVKKVQELLRNGVDVNAKDSTGFPALLNAAEWGRVEIVNLLLDNGANVNTKIDGGQTALMRASGAGRLDVVKLLLEKGADVNAKVKLGGTALTLAAGRRHLNILELLVEKGANVNAKTGKSDSTALMHAAFQGDLEVVKLLLDKGADVSAKDNGGKTALMGASEMGHTAIVELLKANGAKE